MKILAIETASDACSVALFLDGDYRESHEIAPRKHAEILLSRIERLLGEAGIPLTALDALAFGWGPGAFTGVRIATGVVQGLAFGADLSVVPISSLHVLAQGALRERGAHNVLAAFDARMGEVYWGGYHLVRPLKNNPQQKIAEKATVESLDRGEMVPHGAILAPAFDECVCTPERVPLAVTAGYEPEQGPNWSMDWFGTGSGWGVYDGALRKALADCGDANTHRISDTEPDRYPHARDVATLAVWALARGEAVAPEAALPVYLRNRVTRQMQRRPRAASLAVNEDLAEVGPSNVNSVSQNH